ncbi:hypothetical protein RFI_26932 [Reticulomyxa filosa]|uniref:Uncharacterized protein n=1 Tax=Reticulomyxa filosa TaxID=46433 RepID=X6M996_RETFI|nr:hypothetical protein RFI_26932 [Reticulomyxa filosa]|eukprot:ETO10444.1 hypothetical protein RFI_26932 [Reticulomyxa filosa]
MNLRLRQALPNAFLRCKSPVDLILRVFPMNFQTNSQSAPSPLRHILLSLIAARSTFNETSNEHKKSMQLQPKPEITKAHEMEALNIVRSWLLTEDLNFLTPKEIQALFQAFSLQLPPDLIKVACQKISAHLAKGEPSSGVEFIVSFGLIPYFSVISKSFVKEKEEEERRGEGGVWEGKKRGEKVYHTIKIHHKKKNNNNKNKK